MKCTSAIAIVAISLMAGSGAAFAADINADPVIEPMPEPVNSSGWYIRGDLGYNFKSSTDGDWSFWNQFDPPYRGIDDTLRYDDFDLKAAQLTAWVSVTASPICSAPMPHSTSSVQASTVAPPAQAM